MEKDFKMEKGLKDNVTLRIILLYFNICKKSYAFLIDCPKSIKPSSTQQNAKASIFYVLHLTNHFLLIVARNNVIHVRL
jgi:hypothetical protein